MVILEPCAETEPSGSCPGRRREWAIAERAYPATSSGWQVTQRLAPVGGFDGESCGCCSAEARSLCGGAAAGVGEDWLRIAETLKRRTRKNRRRIATRQVAVAR